MLNVDVSETTDHMSNDKGSLDIDSKGKTHFIILYKGHHRNVHKCLLGIKNCKVEMFRTDHMIPRL
jgi:hypothetical protein